MELERALKLIVDNKDVDPDIFNMAVQETLHDAVLEIRKRLEKGNLHSTEHGGKWLQLGEVYTGAMEHTRDHATFQWTSGFTVGGKYELDVMVNVLNFGVYSHEPSITVKLVDRDKNILYMKDVWFKDDGVSFIYSMALGAIAAIPGPKPIKFDTVCKADEPKPVTSREEWFYMKFWDDSTLLDIVRSTDYDEILLKWHRDVNRRCTPIMKGRWPMPDEEKNTPGEIVKENK